MLVITQKKYWINGYQSRAGGNFKTFALSFLSFAVMLCWGKNFGYFKNGKIQDKPTIYFYKLI